MRLVYLERPKEFNPKFEVVSCFVRCNNKFLFVHRQDHKPEGNTWSVPAGKIDQGEDVLEAMSRELFEETGLQIVAERFKEPLKTFVKYPSKDFIYYITEVSSETLPEIKLSNDEHKGFEWLTLEQALKRKLIPGEDECIQYYYNLN